MHGDVTVRSLAGSLGVVFLALAGTACARADEPAASNVMEAVANASHAYANALNQGDMQAVADHWTAKARLVEGGVEFVGRDAIVRSLEAWRGRHPEARIEIVLPQAELLADSLARVTGELWFTAKPGAKTLKSRFASLRVRENDGTWRIVDSVVTPVPAALLDEFDWLIGDWANDPGRCGEGIEARFTQLVGGGCIVGRITFRPWNGPVARESLLVIRPDRDGSAVGVWVFDSNGARAEGTVDSDGTSYHLTMEGVPADTARGSTARWVQVIAPTGDDSFTLHDIERSIDGVPLPDGAPVHMKRVRPTDGAAAAPSP